MQTTLATQKSGNYHHLHTSGLKRFMVRKSVRTLARLPPRLEGKLPFSSMGYLGISTTLYACAFASPYVHWLSRLWGPCDLYKNIQTHWFTNSPEPDPEESYILWTQSSQIHFMFLWVNLFFCNLSSSAEVLSLCTAALSTCPSMKEPLEPVLALVYLRSFTKALLFGRQAQIMCCIWKFLSCSW